MLQWWSFRTRTSDTRSMQAGARTSLPGMSGTQSSSWNPYQYGTFLLDNACSPVCRHSPGCPKTYPVDTCSNAALCPPRWRSACPTTWIALQGCTCLLDMPGTGLSRTQPCKNCRCQPGTSDTFQRRWRAARQNTFPRRTQCNPIGRPVSTMGCMFPRDTPGRTSIRWKIGSTQVRMQCRSRMQGRSRFCRPCMCSTGLARSQSRILACMRLMLLPAAKTRPKLHS